MELYSGIDLHSNNLVLVVINQEDRVVYQKRLANNLELILEQLKPFQPELRGIAVESTFNWYWLVDGLMDAGYPLHLVNTSAVMQYEGLKYTDDDHDAFWLAHLLRLGILPTGYIYPKEQRAVRDLARKRVRLVQQRTSFILSAKSLFERLTGKQADSNVIKRPTAYDIYLPVIDDKNHRMELASNFNLIQTLDSQIGQIEKSVTGQIKLDPSYQILQTVPGIGLILALTIMLETGDISRFASAGNYASYSRCVSGKRTSNGKSKGRGNTKNGNKYLGWAFVEAAHHAQRFNPQAKRFYQRKLAQRNSIVATKALANKLAKACFFMLRNRESFNSDRLFH